MNQMDEIERIQNEAEHYALTSNPPRHMVKLKLQDFNYLIKRVQELEIRCAEIAGESAAIEERSFKKIKALESQVKRYREAFKQIKLQILFDGAIEDHRKNIIEIIDEALEESE